MSIPTREDSRTRDYCAQPYESLDQLFDDEIVPLANTGVNIELCLPETENEINDYFRDSIRKMPEFQGITVHSEL